MKTAELLQTLLRQTGLTQVQLAARLSVSHQSLSKWLGGKATPRAHKQAEIEALAVGLLGGEVADEVLARTIQQAENTKLSIGWLLSNDYLLDNFVVLMTYNTNSIEGSTMTLADTHKVLLEQKVLTNRSAREQLEARNHQAALMWLLEQVNEGRFHLDVAMVRELHQRLMNGLLIEAGEYRQHGVRIMGSRVTVANYLKVPEQMEELLTRQWTGDMADMAQLHAEFERIHPFSDGNGRVGRLLLVGVALMSGQMPPVVAREARAAYYRALEKAQVFDEPRELEYFLARAVVSAHELLMKGAK